MFLFGVPVRSMHYCAHMLVLSSFLHLSISIPVFPYSSISFTSHSADANPGHYLVKIRKMSSGHNLFVRTVRTGQNLDTIALPNFQSNWLVKCRIKFLPSRHPFYLLPVSSPLPRSLILPCLYLSCRSVIAGLA